MRTIPPTCSNIYSNKFGQTKHSADPHSAALHAWDSKRFRSRWSGGIVDDTSKICAKFVYCKPKIITVLPRLFRDLIFSTLVGCPTLWRQT